MTVNFYIEAALGTFHIEANEVLLTVSLVF